MLMKKLVPHFVPYACCGLITMSQKFYKNCLKIFPSMLALRLMFSETKNYAGIIGLGPWALLLHIIKPDITAMVIDLQYEVSQNCK